MSVFVPTPTSIPSTAQMEPIGTKEVYANPDLAAERAIDYVKQGFTAVKFDPAGAYTVYDGGMPTLEELDRSERFVRQIREAVGNKADMLFGTHGQFTAAGAIRLAKRLEPYDPLWFEEPTPPENPKRDGPRGQANLHSRGHRASGCAPSGSLPGCSNIRPPRSCKWLWAGWAGLLEGKKIAGMAETYYAQLAPHLYCGPIEGAANAQLATCTPNFLILESIEQWGGFHAEILKKPMTWEEGYVIPPTEPGIGVELNEEVADAHPYDDTALHLEMGPDPVR